MDYVPSPVPIDPQEIPRYLIEELNRIAETMRTSSARQFEILHVAPAKPREGMVYGADGTDWNPGAGAGIYSYIGGAWTKL